MFSVQNLRLPFPTAVSCLAALLMVSAMPTTGWAQKSSSRGNRAPNVNLLDQKAAAAQEQFLNSQAELAREYEEIGEIEKAQSVLRTMLKLSPDLTQIRDKIEALEESRIAGNEVTMEIDPSRGWMPTNVAVQKDKIIRFESTGEFRMLINQTVTPSGFQTEDVKTDLAAGVPLGALMGLIVDGKGKSGDPFAVGQKSEVKASQEGQLFVRVNVPPGSKCTGKIRLQITGDIITRGNASSGR